MNGTYRYCMLGHRIPVRICNCPVRHYLTLKKSNQFTIFLISFGEGGKGIELEIIPCAVEALLAANGHATAVVGRTGVSGTTILQNATLLHRLFFPLQNRKISINFKILNSEHHLVHSRLSFKVIIFRPE